MTNRLGRKYGGAKQRGRRVAVWFYVCEQCGNEMDKMARRRPTEDPDADVASPICCGYAMTNKGIFFLEVTDGKKKRTVATELRKEWERYRWVAFHGKTCECGHYRADHSPIPPFHICKSAEGGLHYSVEEQKWIKDETRGCGCTGFVLKKYEPLPRGPEDEEVPF